MFTWIYIFYAYISNVVIENSQTCISDPIENLMSPISVRSERARTFTTAYVKNTDYIGNITT